VRRSKKKRKNTSKIQSLPCMRVGGRNKKINLEMYNKIYLRKRNIQVE